MKRLSGMKTRIYSTGRMACLLALCLPFILYGVFYHDFLAIIFPSLLLGVSGIILMADVLLWLSVLMKIRLDVHLLSNYGHIDTTGIVILDSNRKCLFPGFDTQWKWKSRPNSQQVYSLPELKGSDFGMSCRLAYTINKRGVYELTGFVLRISDLLGLFTIHILKTMNETLYITPKPISVQKMEWKGQGDKEYQAISKKVSLSQLELFDLKPYQSGDDIRRIHWKALARKGELIVRHPEKETGQVQTLVCMIDTFSQRPSLNRSAFGQALLSHYCAISYGLIRHLWDHFHKLTVIGYGHASELMGISGQEELPRLMASLQWCQEPAIIPQREQWISRQMHNSGEGIHCLVLTPGLGEKHLQSVFILCGKWGWSFSCLHWNSHKHAKDQKHRTSGFHVPSSFWKRFQTQSYPQRDGKLVLPLSPEKRSVPSRNDIQWLQAQNTLIQEWGMNHPDRYAVMQEAFHES